MKNLIRKIKTGMLRAQIEAKSFMLNEQGDTNFISIAIIMIVVIAVAVVFIGFKDTILGWFNNSVDDLKDALNGTEAVTKY